jgi:hypothetical protein
VQPSDRAPSQIVREGRTYYPIGLRVEAGWRDARGRQFSWDFKLLCEGCGSTSGEAVLNDEDEYEIRRKVTTDSRGRTFCADCRYQADIIGVDPRHAELAR